MTVEERATTQEEERRRRQGTIKLAWSSSVLSKLLALGTQALALPLAYRALGDEGFAAFAAVTASASLLGSLNLGIGGSLVTPVAIAAAKGDEHRQTVLVQAGLAPLILLCLIGAMLVIPLAATLPLSVLFGKVGADASLDLRLALIIAVTATLLSIPLSAIDILRQAYGEMHLNNLIGSGYNVCLAGTLIVTARHTHSLAAFVAVFTIIPLLARVVNCTWLLQQRKYLVRHSSGVTLKESAGLLSDGIRYLGSSASYLLIYQWPIYWVARTQTAHESAVFALSIQVVLLPLSLAVSLVQPLWALIADASARQDYAWVVSLVKTARVTITAVAIPTLAVMLLVGDRIVAIWLRRPIALSWQLRGLIAAYVMLAIWEYFHFTLALGLGRLRAGTMAVFQRSALFAIVVPLLTALGGPWALWWGLCCSVVFWTAWRLPMVAQTGLPASTD